MTTPATFFDPATLDDAGLGLHSVEVLLGGQSDSGAFIACANFPSYRYAWLRDGAYCARALDVVGHHQAAGRFHRWVERTVLLHRVAAEAVIARLEAGEIPPMEQMLPTRYALDGSLERPGEVEDEPWPNYQLDGYGAWLHELAAHHERTGVPDFDVQAVDLIARYLAAAWRTDCYDCWEELGDGQHASTVGAVAAGLAAAGSLLGRQDYRDCAAQVRASLLDRFVRGERFRKGQSDDRVDGSLLWLAVPFAVVEPGHPAMVRTAEALRHDLRGRTSGVYRYLGDTYFGGGEWMLLTAWLGWYDAVTGNAAECELSRRWVVDHAGPQLDLAEQTTDGAQDPPMVGPWVRRWGPVASPLLWSHAMYLILSEAAPS